MKPRLTNELGNLERLASIREQKEFEALEKQYTEDQTYSSEDLVFAWQMGYDSCCYEQLGGGDGDGDDN
jgi:hypothetical protein